jgi:hypothetical protein
MRHPVMLIGIAAVSLVLGAAPAAHAANPGVNRFTFSTAFTDPDFRGTGQAVDVTVSAMGTEFLSPNQHVDYASAFHAWLTYTNHDTGASVISRTTGRFTTLDISGDPNGIHIVEATNMGLQQFRLEHGGVLMTDAGLVTRRATYNAEEFVSVEITISKGPHPLFESGADGNDQLTCEVLPSAPGL